MKLARLTINLFGLLLATTGLAGIARRVRHRNSGKRLHILEYHGVSEDGLETEGIISQQRFLQHIRYLKRNYRVSSHLEASHFLKGEYSPSRDLVLITFDDGYANNFTAAWPVLAQESVPAIVFLTTGFLDGTPLWFDVARRSLETLQSLHGTQLPDLLAKLRLDTTRGTGRSSVDQVVEHLKSLPEDRRVRAVEELQDESGSPKDLSRPVLWSQVLKMHRAGIEIGGHTVTHPILSKLSKKRQEEEIMGCWARIYDATGIDSTAFAYPNGSMIDFNEDTFAVLHSSRFAVAMTTHRGSNLPGSDPYSLRRIGVGSDSTWLLSARLSGLLDHELRRWLPRRNRHRGRSS